MLGGEEPRRHSRRRASGRGKGSGRALGGADGRRSAPIRFADFELDVDAGELRRKGKRVAIAQKPFSMLSYLAANSDRSVPKTELLRRLWPKVVVSDAAFSSALKDLRRALGDEGARPRFVSTVRGRGVRFIAEISGSRRIRQSGTAKAPEPPPSLVQAPFVGRLRELRSLSRAGEGAARGKPQLVVITGEAGAGKTRLVEELLRDPGSADFAIGRGSCHADEAEPYHPFALAFRDRLAQNDGGVGRPGTGESEFHQLLNPSRAVTRIGRSDPSYGPREETELQAAIWRVLERLARAHATLLVIEDLHHAAPSTLELLTSLAIEIADAQHGDGVPLLIVATTQAPEAGSPLDLALRRIKRQPGCSSIAVAGLGVRAVGDLLAGIGAARPTGSAAKAVQEATAGNPYLLTLLAREETGIRTGSGEPIAAPRAPIASRLARLSSETRRVLTVAAFCGDEFGPLALGAATGLAPRGIAAALDEAVALGIVVGAARSFRFDHDLIRESLREAAPEETRAEIHLTLANVLEEIHSDAANQRSIEIARHLLLAGTRADPVRVVLFARTAGDQAYALCAWSEAAEFYEAGLAAGSRLSGAERAEIHFRAGLATSRALEMQRAYEHFTAAVREFRAAGDDAGVAWALMNAARLRALLTPSTARDSEDLERLQTLFGSLGEGQPALRGQMLASLAAAARHCRNDQLAEDFAEQALAIGRAVEDDVVCHFACEQIALARYSRLRIRESLAAWLDADAYARRSRDPWLQSLVGPLIAYGLEHLGRLAEARTAAHGAEAQARSAKNRARLALVLAVQGSIELASGNLALAEERVRQALSTADVTGEGWAAVICYVVRACAACHQGRWSAAEAALAELAGRSRASVAAGFLGAVSEAALRLVLIAHRAPQEVDRGELSALVDRALGEGLRGPQLIAHTRLAEVAILVGATEQSLALEEPLRVAEAHGFVLNGPRAVMLSRLQAGCALLDGRLDEAEGYFGKALARARLCGARIEIATTLLERAQMQARHGRIGRELERARSDAAEARSLARELGLALLEKRAAALSRELASRRR